jgi:hypothetical protein
MADPSHDPYAEPDKGRRWVRALVITVLVVAVLVVILLVAGGGGHGPSRHF